MLAREAEPERKSIPGARQPVSRKRQAGRGLARGTIRLTRDARRFNRDVRDGMDLYLARHPGRQGSTLGASKDGASKDGASKDNDEPVKDDR
jgi:hypothetical protein